MPNPILHSTLTKMLVDLPDIPANETTRKKIEAIITSSAGGVYPEAAPFNVPVTLPAYSDRAGGLEKELPTRPKATIVDAERHDYKLGVSSNQQLEGVHPQLVAVVRLAITLTMQDFTVYDGIRTLKEQREYLRRGTTKTLQSMHLPQSDGYGHAVDLVPWINGKPTWDWDGCYKIAFAMDQAATQLGCAHNIVWGGAWDRRLADFGGDFQAYATEVRKYRDRHPGGDFIDGPHFEWRDS